ncbi:uncharacterized protein [Chironomus tepperi]|uniref:uncharacterized protein n=1 Tax=Chironomus tepperi TaxID=113505 RepID=UPI00391F7695
MVKLQEILTISATFLNFSTSDFPPACLNMLDKNVYLFDCCEYPVIPRSKSIYRKCLGDCSPFDYCCFQECSATENGSFSNGTMDVEKTKQIFAIQKGHKRYSNLTEQWMNIVNDSVDKCSSIPSSPDQKTCEFIYESMACIFKENFLNCPNMKDKIECKDVKMDMQECSQSEGSWKFITDAFNSVKPRAYAKRYET